MLSAREYFENQPTDKPYTREEMVEIDGDYYVTPAMVKYAHGQQGLNRLLATVVTVNNQLISADDYERWVRNDYERWIKS